MSQPPLIALHNARVSFGGKALFENVTIFLEKGKRTCLVGRNGCGKSTLMKVIAGVIESEHDEFFIQPHIKIHYLPQDEDFPDDKTVLEVALQDDVPQHETESMLDQLDMKPDWLCQTLSGGQKRRLALAKAMAGDPDVLMLDEPTNHLDMPTIEWLEKELRSFRGSLLLISHDRTFLSNVSNQTFWMDRGSLRTLDKGYTAFETWYEETLEEEARILDKLAGKLRQEEDWLQGGVTARRKRNQRRLQDLHRLREQRANLLHNRTKQAKLCPLEPSLASRVAIEAQNIRKSYGDRALIKDFSTRIMRGDRIGIIGPNGAGKTTLVKLLVGRLAPDEGRVKLGKTLELVYFDQLRESLKPNLTPWQWLCGNGGDHLMVQGQSRHVMAHLKDFLFDEKKARAMISTLSGGERNRLALAKALAEQGNLLVLDEPTNDLDMDTLDLLQELLSDFQGTLILVSHDRDFLDRLTTSIIALEGDGEVQEVIGGYKEYLAQRRQRVTKAPEKPRPTAPSPEPQLNRRKMTFKERIELEKLPQMITDATALCQKLEAALADPNLYDKGFDAIQKINQDLESARAHLEALETRWLELEELSLGD